jgi:rubrerythrin
MTDSAEDFVTAGAVLAGKDALEVDDLRLMFRLERAGEEFYRQLADGCDNAEAADLFRKNGREERGHAERVRRAIGLKLGHDYEPDEDDLRPLTVSIPSPLPLELLPHIVAGEINGDAGYQRWADGEADPDVQRLLRQNGREETVHGERVRHAMDLLGVTT